MLTTFTTDFGRMGSTFDVSARFSGALVAFVVVATILLLHVDHPGLGAPARRAGAHLVTGPGHEGSGLPTGGAAGRVRCAVGVGADTVAGLRVLRGIGAREEFVRRYAAQSGRVRSAGVRLAGIQALLESAQVLLPGIFVLVVVGVGAHLAIRGDISQGQLVAFFGYDVPHHPAAVSAVEFVDKLTSTRVAARRLARILAIAPDHPGKPCTLASRHSSEGEHAACS